MLAAALAAVLATAPEAPPVAETPGTEEERAAAKAAFDRGREHAAAGRYEEAIVDFEQALALRPSPGLHYNIAVCHHRLLLAADEESQTYETHRAAAVIAYNAYLDAAPQAKDRYAVAATIQDLQGRPNLIDDWRIDDGDPGRATLELREEDEATPEQEPPTDEHPAPEQPPAELPPLRPDAPAITPMRPGFPHGMLSLGLGVEGPSPAPMAGTAGIDSVPGLGPVLRGGGFIGDERELLVGGEFAWSSTVTPANRGHRLTTIQFMVLIDWARAVGRSKRLELGLSNTVGIVGQTMAHGRGSPATCPVRSTGVVSSRGGVVVGTRFLLRAVLGKKKRHAIALRVGPSGGAFGGGSKDSACEEGGPSPFSEYEIGDGSLILRSDVSYALRW